MTAPLLSSPAGLDAAHRALDARAFNRHGPLAAVLRSPSVETLTRRAAACLWRDDVTPSDVATVLAMWRLLNPGQVAA